METVKQYCISVIVKKLTEVTLTEQEMERLFSYLERQTLFTTAQSYTQAVALRDFALISLLYFCALCPGELLSLRLKSVDYEQAQLHILDKEGAEKRIINMGIPALKAVKRYLCEARPFFAAENSSHLFLSPKGKNVTAGIVRYTLKKTLVKVDINNEFRVLDLRHSRTIHMLKDGVDIDYLQKFLGHK